MTAPFSPQCLRAEDLETAAEILGDPEKWGQNNYGFYTHNNTADDTGTYCYLGAVRKAAFLRGVVGNTLNTLLTDEAHDLAKVVANGEFTAVTVWNDQPGRTHLQVAEFAMKCGKFLRDQGEK